jgi:flagellin-like hook-associated protein FlgL
LVTQSSDDDDSGRPGNGNANGLGNGNGNGNAHGHDDDDDDGGIVVSNTLNAELELTIGGIPGEGGTEFDRVVTINVADNEALNDTFRQVGSAIAQAEESAALINGQADEIASNLSFNIEVQGILEETLAKIVDFDLPTANAQLVAQQIGRQLATQQLSIANQDTQSVPSLLNQNNLFGQPKDDNPFGSQQSNLFGAPESGSIFSQPAEQEDNLFPVFGRGF